MSLQDATGWITRTALTLPNLELFIPDALPARQDIPIYDFVVDGLSIGATVKRRQIAESDYMDDAFQAQSSKARIPCQLGFFVTGKDSDRLQAFVGDLADAVNQGSWEMHVLIGGATEWAWSFWDSEITLGFPVAAWYGLWQPLLVSTVRSPVSVAGPQV